MYTLSESSLLDMYTDGFVLLSQLGTVCIAAPGTCYTMNTEVIMRWHIAHGGLAGSLRPVAI